MTNATVHYPPSIRSGCYRRIYLPHICGDAMNQYTHAWPLARTNKLKKLFRKGLTFLEIARELGTNRSAVAGKLNRLGMYRRPASVWTAKVDSKSPIDRFGDWDKIGVFKHCKWLKDNKEFCHEPVEKGSIFTFCPEHMKKVLSRRKQNVQKNKPILWSKFTSSH